MPNPPLPSGSSIAGVSKTSMNVAYVRQELQDELPRYQFMQTIMGGHYSVKKAGNNVDLGGLPKIKPYDTSEENTERNAVYLQRAIFYNFCTRTTRALVGAIFLKPPVLELPKEFDAMKNNVDGEGQTMAQLLKLTCGYVLPYGRSGLLTDMPELESGITKKQIIDGDVKATISAYAPWDIINWRESADEEKTLQLLVLREHFDDETDDFITETREQYRVLRLVNGQCTVTIWRPTGKKVNGKHEFKPDKPRTINGQGGQPIDFIPFEWVGSENNDSVMDYPPMYDLSVLNHGHYMDSADHQESVFLVGQPQAVLVNVTQEWVDENLSDGVLYMGSREPWILGPDSNAMLLQAEPNTLVFEAMKHKEDQARQIGAKLIEDARRVEKTATEAEIDSGSENSVLTDVVQNVQKAMLKSIRYAASFLNIEINEDELKVELNDNFDLTGLLPEEIRFLIELAEKQLITLAEVRTVLRRSGMATEDMETYLASIKEDRKTLDELVPKLEKDAAAAKNKNPEGKTNATK